MLILLDENIGDEAELLTEKESEALEDLLLCHSKLYHYVGASRRNVMNLVKKLGPKLTKRSVQTLNLISSQSSELRAITQAAKFHAIVKRSEMVGVIRRSVGVYQTWTCDLQYASNWFAHPSTLIGEHLVDTKIFKFAGIDTAAEYGISLSMQRLNSEMSGGCGNAPDVLRNRIESGLCPVLCIIDSDKYIPTPALALNAQKCQEIVEEMGGVSKFY